MISPIPLKIGICAVAMVILLAPEAHSQQVDPRLAKVLTDWEKRQNAVDAIRYEVKGENVVPKGSLRDPYGEKLLTPPAPPQDMVGEIRWLILLDFKNGRHRREVSEEVYSYSHRRFIPEVHVNVCDGKRVKGSMPRDKNTTDFFTPSPDEPDLVIVSGNLRGVAFQYEYAPLFFGHGMIRTDMAEIVPGRLRSKPDAEYLLFHGEGVHRGRKCNIVRTQTLKLGTTSFDEFWTDPTKDSAIVRYVMYSGKEVFNDFDIHYQQTPVGWLPERWTYTHYTDRAPSVIHRMQVTSWQADPPMTDADFDLPISPGMVVEEREYEETNHPLRNPRAAVRIYRLDERGGKTEVPDVFGRPRSLNGGANKKWWYWGVGGLVVCGLIVLSAFVAVKKFRASRA